MWKKNSNTSQVQNTYVIFSIKLLIFVAFLIVFSFLYKIGHILLLLVFSLFLNILFSPILNTFNKWKISDIFGMIIIYMIIIWVVLLTLFSVIPIFTTQFSELLQLISRNISHLIEVYNSQGLEGLKLPPVIINILEDIHLPDILRALQSNIGQISAFVSKHFTSFLTNGAGVLFSITNVFLDFILVFIFSFFIALERFELKAFFYKVLPSPLSKYLQKKEDAITLTLSAWLKGQILLALSIFLMTLIVLGIVKIFVPELTHIFTLALVAGMMEFIPFLGPILALLPALAIALGISWQASLVIVILYIIIQQVESNVLVPYIMGRTLSLSPFSVLLGMLIGGSILGIVGIIVSVPFVAIIQLFVKDYLSKKKN